MMRYILLVLVICLGVMNVLYADDGYDDCTTKCYYDKDGNYVCEVRCV